MWEDVIEPLVSKIKSPETILILGSSDTGKTTFAIELAMRIAKLHPVAFVDSDIGQSRIGPPTAIGWSLMDSPDKDLSEFETRGLFFVGAVSPVGHLLQFTAALIKCVKQAAAAGIVIVDTPGYVGIPAATSLWWAVSYVLCPSKILLLQKRDELAEFILGVKGLNCELIETQTPAQVPLKSMVQRTLNRQKKYDEYFRNSSVYEISLSNVAIQERENLLSYMYINRMVALRDSDGNDLAIGRIIKWDSVKTVVQAPEIDVKKITCLVIGDVFYEDYEGNGT